MTGGASGPWHDLRQMLLTNLNAIGAFGAADQLGLTIGHPQLAHEAFSIVRDNSTQQLVIEEYMLELAPHAILYHQEDQGFGKVVDDHHRYPPDQAEGTQPRLPLPGRPDNLVVGNQMGGDLQDAAQKQHESSDQRDGGEM